MLHRLALAVGLLIAASAPALAVCPTPLTIKDASAATQNVSTTDDAAGSCAANGMIMDFAGTNLAGVNSSHQILIAPLVAGSAVAGKFGLDQTTPGTTNATAIAQINAVTALAGAGAVGTGSLRVAVGQDTTTIAGSAPGTAGTASANVITIQGVASMTAVATSAASGAYVDGSISTIGTKGDSAWVSGSGSVVALLKTLAGGVINTADEGTFTFGTTVNLPAACVYQTTPTSNALTTGQMGTVQCSSNRAMFTNSYQWAGGVLGAMANYGTSPGAVLVPGMNSFITNIPHFVCDSGCSSSTAPADESTFTPGTTSQSPIGCWFQTTVTNNALTNLQMGAPQCTAARSLFTNAYQLAGTVLGAPSNYGTSPGAVEVPGVNAFVTNTVTITGTVTANAGTNLNTSALALETGGNLATIAGAITSSVVQSNTKQVNGVTTLTGTGATGTGSQRMTVATDTATIAGSAPGTAGSASANVLSVQGVASMTALNVAGAAASGASKAGNPVQIGGVFNTTQPTVTTGQAVEVQATARGAQIVSTGVDTFNVTVNAALPAGTALLGKVGIDQTTPGTTNGISIVGVNAATALAGAGAVGTGAQRVAVGQDATTIAGAAPGTVAAGTAAANSVLTGCVYNNAFPTPSTGQGMATQCNNIGALSVAGGQNTTGVLSPVPESGGSVAIAISTATTTQLVALSSGKAIYVTAWDVIAAGTGNIQLEYGTGSNCGTGTTVLTGNYNLTAQAGISKGSGYGAILFVPASNALCALTSAAVGMAGSVSYAQY